MVTFVVSSVLKHLEYKGGANSWKTNNSIFLMQLDPYPLVTCYGL